MKKALSFTMVLVLAMLFSFASAEEWTCPTCDRTAEGNFCSYCGREKPVAVWICENCGKVSEGDFCNNCGSRKPDQATNATFFDLAYMEIYSNPWQANKCDKYLTDNCGNTYSSSLSASRGSLTYQVEYDTLNKRGKDCYLFTGTVAFPGAIENDEGNSVTLSIYGDKELIAEFQEVNGSWKPQEFNIDISPYGYLKLEWTCIGTGDWYNWGHFATIFDGRIYYK